MKYIILTSLLFFGFFSCGSGKEKKESVHEPQKELINSDMQNHLEQVFVIPLEKYSLVCSKENKQIKELFRIPHDSNQDRYTKKEVYFSPRTVVVDNQWVCVGSSDLTIYNLKGQLLTQFELGFKSLQLLAVGSKLFIGGSNNSNPEAAYLAYMDLEKDLQKVFEVPAPDIKGKYKIVPDIAYQNGKIKLVAKDLTKTFWLNYTFDQDGSIQLLSSEPSQKGFPYTNVQKIQANEDYLVYMSSAGASSKDIREEFIIIEGKAKGFFQALSKYHSQIPKGIDPNQDYQEEEFTDFCLLKDQLYIVRNKEVYQLDLKEPVLRKSNLVKIPVQLPEVSRLSSTPEHQLIAIYGDQYEIINE